MAAPSSHRSQLPARSKQSGALLGSALLPANGSAGECGIRSLLRAYYPLVLLFAALATLYLGAVLILPSKDSILAQYGITTNYAVALTVAIYVPFVLVWFIALVGYLHLKDYTRQITPSLDGKAFAGITQGIFLLTLWLPLSAIVMIATAFARSDNHWAPLLVRSGNYLNVLVLLAAFLLIYFGSKRLLTMIQSAEPSPFIGAIIFIVFATLYAYLTFHNVGPDLPASRAVIASSYLPDWLLLLTVIIPRLVAWYIGMRAAYNLSAYCRQVSGKIYREALSSLALGVGGVVVLSAAYRSLQTLIPRVASASLLVVLTVVYGLLVVIAVGYMVMARGARQLHRIEKS